MSHPATLGSYVVERELGRGGMGVVYLARDPRLNRHVAVKVLSGDLSRQPEHLARFEREAKHLASLNHPNIAAIYGIEDIETAGPAEARPDHQRLLVLEYVPGDTLAQRVKFGALPVGEALDYGRQIALALEAAHDNGVIHRDLKPGNVVITPDGQVKVLDFGLAKGSAASSSDVDLARSPTFTYSPTAAGVILGTAAYMSPEQARGKPVDKRTDIWAFGCVLFECLTGRQFFQGETVSDTIARILERDPDWSLLPADTPPKVRELLRRCLEKDVKKRQRDIGDVRIELEEAINAAFSSRQAAAIPETARTSRQPRLTLAVAAGVLAGALAGIGLWTALGARSGPDSTSTPIRMAVNFPPSIRVVYAGMSLDGEMVVLAGFGRGADGNEESRARLYSRRLDGYELKAIPGTEGVMSATLSPDGHWLAFVSTSSGQASQRRISKVRIDGSSPPIALVDFDDTWNQNLVWLEDGDLLVAARAGAEASFFRLPTEPGPPKPPVKIDTGSLLIYPSFGTALPGDRAVFLHVNSYGPQGYQEDVWLLDPRTGKATPLIENAGNVTYVPSGHIVFSRGDTLYGATFDLATLQKGPLIALSGGLRTPSSWQPGIFSLSRTGTLLYLPGERVGADRQLVVVDSDGTTVAPFVADRRGYETNPALSRDGRRAAVIVPNDATYEIWIADRDRSTRRVVAIPNADVSAPIWSPDGLQIAYNRNSLSAEDGVYLQRVDANEPARLLVKSEAPDVFLAPTSWARDNSGVIVMRSAKGNDDLLFVPLGDNGQPEPPRPLRATGYDEVDAVLSPDGTMVAFGSDESGEGQVWIASYRNGTLGVPVQVPSADSQPVWSSDSRRLYFEDRSEKVQWVSVQAEPLSVSAPTLAYDLRKLRLSNWDLLPDGRLFGIQKGAGEDDIASFNIVLNWFSELRTRMGSR